MSRVVLALGLLTCVGGCDLLPGFLTPTPFTLEMTPKLIGDSIVGQKIVLLAKVTDEEAQAWPTLPIMVTASADGATVTVTPPLVTSGQVAEITVVPVERQNERAQVIIHGDDDWRVNVTIRAERLGLVETATVPITVISNEPDLVSETAAEMRDLFIPWLAENRPDLGIGENTKWVGTIVTPHILVVTHYLYFSAEWEMHVYWHVMIPPYDWARIELRRRYHETTPSVAFEIPSRAATDRVVQEIEPEPTLWR
ncbi:MAG: hypothetical protein AB1601_01875 [Planctomycetota bacterium]